MASGSGKAKASSWAAVLNVGACTAEALKDRHAGLCGSWSHAFRPVQRRAGSAAAGNSKTKPLHPANGAAARRKAKQDEEDEIRIVMYISNWGPNN